jgi:hypothetical protein
MATIADLRSVNATLSGTTADVVQLTQWWDVIEITNLDTTTPLYVRFDDTVPVAGQEGAFIVPPSAAKVFGPGDGIARGNGVPGSTATPCHVVRVVGSGGSYGAEGHAGS